MSTHFVSDEFSDQTFESLEQKEAMIEGRHFENCTFRQCNFSGAALRNCRFVDCVFERCDLSNVNLQGASFRAVTFRGCKAMGTNWPRAASVTHLNFEESVISYASFVGLTLKKSTFVKCVAREADFADANLSEVDLRGTDFAGARFAKTNFTKADLRGATNYSIRPDSNTLKKAKFSLPEATLLLHGLDIELAE